METVNLILNIVLIIILLIILLVLLKNKNNNNTLSNNDYKELNKIVSVFKETYLSDFLDLESCENDEGSV